MNLPVVPTYPTLLLIAVQSLGMGIGFVSGEVKAEDELQDALRLSVHGYSIELVYINTYNV